MRHTGVCSWVQSPAFPHDRYEGLRRDNGDIFVLLQCEEVTVSRDNIRGLGTLGGGKHHIIIGITNYRQMGELVNEGGSNPESVEEISNIIIRIGVACADTFVAKGVLGFRQDIFRQEDEKNSFSGKAKEFC